jgi:hypothetical protein
LASLRELYDLGLEDLYDLIEIATVNAANRRKE